MPTAAPLVGSGADGQRRLLDGGRPVQRPVGQRASELPRIAFRECARNDTSDELGLRVRIRLTRRELDGAELGREPTLEMRVLASGGSFASSDDRPGYTRTPPWRTSCR